MRRALLIAAALLALAACGRKGQLRPVAGMTAQPVPYGASAPPTTDQALTPPPEAQPARVDDLIRRPERERADDPFELPPQGAR